MALLKHIQRLKYIHFMIKRKATGDLESFAAKNNLCKSAMAGVIQEMKALGFPIGFDRAISSYYYTESGEMVNAFFVKDEQILSPNEAAKIGREVDLCFSEITVFVPCKNV